MIMLHTNDSSRAMNHTFNKKTITDSIDFFAQFQRFMMPSSSDDRTEFFEMPGREHYRLLAYLSSLFNESIIIDIGTHHGSSALALSYNVSNNVHTFDIEDRVTNNRIEYRSNIKYHHDNLFEDEERRKWKELILASKFIFMDVDPHNGTMEIDFYNYLKDINYTGFVVCDDIWQFKGMRDNFWYKIPNTNKYDVTEFGHHSGTGIFTFNRDIKFNTATLEYNENWTLVTAYFNLAKCPDASYEIQQRDTNYYISHSMSTLSLPYNLVIYCDAESVELIKSCRPEYLSSKTSYIIREFDDIKIIGKTVPELREIILDNRKKKPYNFDKRNTASYYIFCMSRYVMMNEVMAKNEFQSTHFCWINICIERMGISNVYRLNESLALNRDKFSTCYIDYVPYDLITDTAKYFEYGRCSMCSGFFTGNGRYMFTVCNSILDTFETYLRDGYGHADEQLYSVVYFEYPDLFEFYYGDYNEMITNYKQMNENINAPVRNIITNSYKHGNYKLCLSVCLKVMQSHDKLICNYDEETLKRIKQISENCRLRIT